MSFVAVLAVALAQVDAGVADAGELDAGLDAAADTVDAGPVNFIADVKLVYDVVTCQSVTLPASLPAAPIDAYCKVQKPRFERFMSHWGTKGRAFLASLRPEVLPPELVYPFGGGDLMMALATFPEAQVITTMSLELAGDPRRLAPVTDAKVLQQSLMALAETSGTTLVSNDSKSVNMSKIQRGEVPGQLSMHLIGLAMHGYVPAAVRYFRIEPDGALHYLTANDFESVGGKTASSLHSKWKAPDFSAAFANVEVEFVPVGQPEAPHRLHRHIAADLSDDGLRKNPGLLKHLEAKGHVAGMTKAASYLLWNDGFSLIRGYLMNNVDFMFSDSTGLLPRFVKQAGLTLETYGSFQKSFLGTWEGYQAELRDTYAAQPTRALPMRFGYPDGSPEKRSHLQVVRRPSGDAGL